MRIVLPGALPDPAAARALLPHLQQAAPTLLGWLARSRASVQPANLAAGCTAHEQWQLRERGFRPEPGQNLGAGLGPLWAAGPPDDEPVWLAELVHVSPTQSGAAMLPAQDLHITTEQSVALFESAQTLFAGSGFALLRDGDHRWRLRPPAELALQSASPALVGATSVNDWWPQDDSARPWRRLVNELQMLWFDHPVNLARQAQGLPPVNSLWLFGGARHGQLDENKAADTRTCDALQAPFAAQDWAGWLAALAELEAQVFQPLARQGTQPGLVLIGHERFATLTPNTLGRWKQWLPGSRDTWRKWWSPPS